MDKLISLQEVFDRVDTLSKHCTDKIIDVPEISFDSLEWVRFGNEPHKLRVVAQRSISNRLGIPHSYLKKCPTDIQAMNLNHWITRERNDQLFVRFDEDEVRAFFTLKYTPVDNFEVLERLDSLGYDLDTRVQCNLDPVFMSLSIPDGKQSFEINGEKMTPGISISNSEVGLASLTVAVFVLRLVCTNGLVSKAEIGASYRHVSSKILTEFPQVLDRVSYELGKQQGRFRLSMESPVDDPSMTIQKFNKQFQLNSPEKEAVEWGWMKEAGYSMFHVVNAYTRASQMDGISAESSYRLQKVDGNILGLLK